MLGWIPYLPPQRPGFWALTEESHLNSILTLQAVLRYGSCKLVEISRFAWKVPLRGNLNEKWWLRWTWTQNTYSLFVGRLGLLQVRYCKRCCAWKKPWTWILWGSVLRSVTGKTMAAAPDQTNWSVLVKRVCYIKYLNVLTIYYFMKSKVVVW